MSADHQLKQYIDRILRLKEEQDELGKDIRDIYAEMKGNGYDKTAAGALVSELRKQGKNPEKFEEQNTVLDLYREAYERASHPHAPARTREKIEEFHPDPRLSAGTTAAGAHQAVLPAGAKSDGVPPVVGQGGAEPGHFDREEPQAVTNSGKRNDLDGCLRPEICGRDRLCVVCERHATAADEELEFLPSVLDVLSEPNHSPSQPLSPAVTPEALSSSQAASGTPFRFKPVNLRPHCRRPENCGGYGSKHCGSCERAARESEVAA